jgi:hypothetical protein
VKRSSLSLAVALVAASIALAGCGRTQSPDEPGSDDPAQVIPIAGSELNKVVLTVDAAKRVGIKTELAREVSTTVPGQGVARHTTIPIAAVIYDRKGATWTYTTSEPLTYVRQPIVIARSDGDLVVLQSGPSAGAAVVTVGSAELLGIEYGVGE